MTEPRFCTKCGRTTDGSCQTMDGKVVCKTCDYQASMRRFARAEQSAREILPNALAEAAARAEIEAESHGAKVPMNIITKSRSIDRGEDRVADLVGQIEHDAWEAGFEAAVRIVEHEKAVTMAKLLRDALADYWETQGVERED